MFEGRLNRVTGAIIALIVVSLVLSCGGGGGAPADTVPPDPPVLTGDSGLQPNGTVSGRVALKATASDNSGTVARVEFFVASSPVLACADSTPKPSGSIFECLWDTVTVTNGAHELTIRAYDSANNSTTSDPVPFSVQNPQLTVSLTGNGSGTVSSDDTRIQCGTECSATYAPNSVVTLMATADPGSRFDGWSGDCSGTGASVQVTMGADKTCTATFSLIPHTLTVSAQGNGSVTITPPGTVCTSSCTETYNSGDTVSLSAEPAAGHAFVNWSGDCTGTDPTVQVTMDADKTCTAHFAQTFLLTVTKTGSGSGSVSSSPQGISCGTDCDERFVSDQNVTLSAQPDPGSRFAGWSGDCSGTGASVQVTMDADKTCTATFIRQHTLSVTRDGNGSGTVSSTPSGINCGTTCSATFDEGTLVTLMATADSTSTFTGWSGAGCSGTGFCQVTMDGDKSVTATFTRNRFSVTINKSGTGTGTVQSTPAGIQCGATCTADFDAGTQITLTATPDSGSSFGGWSGPCSGTGTCQFTVNANTTVGAVFTASQVTITVQKVGSGVVVSTLPTGIQCGRTCQLTVNSGTQVTLTAQPGPAGQSFLGWNGGGCSGTGNCVITPTTDVTIQANFTNTISYSDDIQPIWDTGPGINTPCVNCHGGSGWLFLTGPPSASHAQLVNKTTNACPDKKRVLPDDPENSALILKLTGTTCGPRMPQNGPPFLAQSTIDKIIAWIMAGAPLN